MDGILNCLCLWFLLSIPSTFIVAKTLKHRGEGEDLYPVVNNRTETTQGIAQ